MAQAFHSSVVALARSLGTDCRWESFQGGPPVTQFVLMRDGMTLLCQPGFGSKGALEWLEVYARTVFPERLAGADVRLTTEGGFDRLGKNLGVTHEVQTGDEVFDREVFIDSDASEEMLKGIFATAEVRQAIRSLLAIAPVTVGLGPLPATAMPTDDFVRLGVPWKQTEDRQRLEHLLSGLVRVTHALHLAAQVRGGYRDVPRTAAAAAPLPPRKLRGALAIVIVAVPLFGSFFIPQDHALGGHLLLAGYGVALALALFQCLALALLLRGRSSSFTFVTLGAAVALLGVFAEAHDLGTLNELLDQGPRSRHVGSAHFHVAYKGPSYVEVTASWMHDKPTAHTTDYRMSLVGSDGEVPVTVVTRPGGFGVPWVDWIEPAEGRRR